MSLSGWSCTLGWCVATALFTVIVALFGGPSHTDVGESIYGTWAVAHGQFACAYAVTRRESSPSLRSPSYSLGGSWQARGSGTA
jgi:hypothetical protein